MRYEDQQKIRKNLKASEIVVADAGTSKASKGKGKSKKRVASESQKALKDFGVEYAASGRAKCRGCEITIIKVS